MDRGTGERDTAALGRWNSAVKSVFDRTVALGTFVVLAPMFVCCWLYITTMNPWARAVTTTTRTGLGGNSFGLLNFRAPSDRRWGAVMAATGLIHLPELINVMRGEMSLVGPRPRPVADARVDGAVGVRPGMTGLWMLSPSIELTPAEIDALDRTYVDSWTLGRDIRILCIAAGEVRYGVRMDRREADNGRKQAS